MVNKWIGIGNLGRDPEVRYTPSGKAVANFSIACSETWTKDGEKQTSTEWVNIVAWDRLGEICGEYLTKGKRIYVEGKLQTRKWEDKEGNNRYTTEVVIREMKMLSSQGDTPKTAADEAPFPVEDDIPF